MRRTIFYGWVIVAVTAIVVIVVSGVRSAPGAFLVSMTQEPGWSTASVSFAAAGIVRENVGDYATAFVAAGWIAIIAVFAALGIRRARPTTPGEPLPVGGGT